MSEMEAGGSAEPAEALAALVAKLRAELTGVRTAMRNRAVIEQAKGVLIERLGITPDEGFDHLVRLSQRTNIKLIEIAAAIVGTTAPDPGAPDVVNLIDDELREHVAKTRTREQRTGTASPRPERPEAPVTRRRSARRPETEALQAQHQLLSARISASRSYDEIAEALASVSTGWPAPEVAVVTLLDPDGAQRIVGAYGLTGEVRSQWSRIPPDPGLPVVAAVRDLQSICLTDPDSVRRHFPSYPSLPFPGDALFIAPLTNGGRVLGALALAWNESLPEDEEWQRYLTALVGPASRSVDALMGEEIANAWVHIAGGEAAGGGAPAQVWLPTVIDALHNPAALLSPVIEDGQVVDFRVEYSNSLARRLMTGARVAPDDATLLAIYPVLGSTTLLSAFGQLLQDGEPRRLYGLRGDAPGSGRGSSLDLHAVRLWDRVFAVWRVHTDADMLYDQMLRAERIAQIGSFCWDLRTHEPQYTAELVRLFYGGEEPPPNAELPLADLTGCVHPDDLLAVQDAIRRTVVEGKHLLAEFRGGARLAGRRLRLAGEPVLEGGTVIMVRGLVQDVTEERAVEARLRLAEEALAAQRRRMTDERRAAQALQEALLPTEPELAQTEGVFICGRCRSVEKVGTVDGDWYDAAALAGGATMLVLGDVDDNGLSSMTTAARLRYAVRAYAMLDMAPAEILAAVNSMLIAMEVDHTAMLVVARYDPNSRELRWAAAGQVAPVRYAADGRGSILSGPLGLPLGAAPDVRYSDTTVVLNPGERVLLFTDGFVRADRRKSGGLEIVRRAAEHVDLDDLNAVVEHITSSVGARDDEDLCALMIRVD